MRIPLSSPEISESDIAAVADVLRTTQLSLGSKLNEFECALGSYLGVREVVAVSSGTSALHLSLLALDLREDDEVIVPSFAFIAVANAVRYIDAIPVFVDIDPATLNLDPHKIETAISSKTKAIIVVHTFGVPADMDRIREIAERHQLLLIEDACEALGAEYRGQRVGGIGDIGVFGFYPNKQITAGEGGAAVTQNSEIAQRLRSMRNQGRNASPEWLQHEEIGYNYRISEMNCALVLSQLARLDSVLERRAEVARTYHESLRDQNALELPPQEIQFGNISWFVYVVRLAEGFSTQDRDWIVREMGKRGIGCGRYFAPIHLQPAYRGVPHRCMDLTVTESIAGRTLALPFFNRITEDQIQEVCTTLQDLIQRIRP